MKRYLSLFLTIVMLFGLMGTAFAEGNTPTFVVSEATAAPGETVRVTVSIVNNPQVASVQLEPQYDHDVLEWIDVEQGDYTGTWNPRVDKGFVNWYGPSGHAVDFDGVFATLVFKVNENAPAGDTTVTVSYLEDNVYDDNEENVYFAIQDGKVTVTAPETAYYLVGSMNEWSVDETYKFVPNPENNSEYMLPITLAEGDEFKAVAATGTAPTDWYPDGMDNNYVVDANQAGDVTVYFRPDYSGGEDWHYNCLYIAVPAPEEPAFMTQSLLLSGQLGVRFYVRLPEREGYEYEGVSFTIEGKDGEESTVPFTSDLPTNSKGYYGFTYYVNTIQMADMITATLNYTVDGETQTLVKEYHVMDYFDTFDENYENNPTPYDEVEGLVDLVKATADLGYYVQAYLDETRGDDWNIPDDHALVNKHYTDYTEEDLTEATEGVAEHIVTATKEADKIKKISYALVMDSETAIRLTVTPAAGYTGEFTVIASEDVTYTVTKVSGKYEIKVPLMAHKLSTEYVIIIKADDGTTAATVTTSGLAYIKILLDHYAGNQKAANAAIAIYRYSKFADIVHGDPSDINKDNGSSY